MDICIFGAGAIGGYLGARLLRSGEVRVSLVARGPQLAAIRANGLQIQDINETFTIRPAAATDAPETLPPQDVVVVTLKAPSLPAAPPAIARLLKPEGCAVMLGNGIPWWWNHGAPGRGGPLRLLDPEG